MASARFHAWPRTDLALEAIEADLAKLDPVLQIGWLAVPDILLTDIRIQYLLQCLVLQTHDHVGVRVQPSCYDVGESGNKALYHFYPTRICKCSKPQILTCGTWYPAQGSPCAALSCATSNWKGKHCFSSTYSVVSTGTFSHFSFCTGVHCVFGVRWHLVSG